MGCTSSSATSDSTQQPRRAGGSPVRAADENRPSRNSVIAPAPQHYIVESPERTVFSSQAELEAQREEYWGSRVDGDSMVWATLRSAAEACLSNDLVLSSAILTASGISSPNGTLELCYDERGHEYKVPLYCFSSSPDLVSAAPVPEAIPVSSKIALAAAVPGNELRLKIKINPGDYTFLIDVHENDTIAILKQKILEKSTEVAANSTPGSSVPPVCVVARQRMMLMGKELKNEKQRLFEAKMDDSRVVQVFLKPEQCK